MYNFTYFTCSFSCANELKLQIYTKFAIPDFIILYKMITIIIVIV